MLPFEQLLVYTFLVVTFVVLPFLRLWQLTRKYDALCFLGAYYVFLSFIFLFVFSLQVEKFELIPSILSSLVIAELTLTLVWVELSKRPELKLLGFVPIIHDKQTTGFRKADYNSELSEPSRFLGIREASFESLKFDEQLTFSVDLSNVGYQQIMVHDYVVYVDGKRQSPIALGKRPQVERLRLITQQRYPIDMLPLYIENAGFHKVRVEVSATTAKCSKEIWLFISEDFQKLRYLEIYPLKRLLSPIIRDKLKDS